jgi:hypothetical protein
MLRKNRFIFRGANHKPSKKKKNTAWRWYLLHVRARGSVVSWGTMLQVGRSPVLSRMRWIFNLPNTYRLSRKWEPQPLAHSKGLHGLYRNNFTLPAWLILRFWIWRRHIPSKRPLTSNGLHGAYVLEYTSLHIYRCQNLKVSITHIRMLFLKPICWFIVTFEKCMPCHRWTRK